ncbi:hypothetical protein M378DRAFT_157929 [Amanita muscaria Koide BX008]|uniref:Uncharacterized protein n=1 Tax=Amanita muscaria (strain Koide BX008) TaxID=946122 RepID=A0A0C2XII1_AMAMK|nr:hypothetical protein M378DRAFT_157929 [Amanita muscaria Koide BX008]
MKLLEARTLDKRNQALNWPMSCKPLPAPANSQSMMLILDSIPKLRRMEPVPRSPFENILTSPSNSPRKISLNLEMDASTPLHSL